MGVGWEGEGVSLMLKVHLYWYLSDVFRPLSKNPWLW